jgi:hypothetical protein
MNGRTVLLVLVGLTALRATVVFWTEIAPQEAYYALCAHLLAPAYFDGPPGTALLALPGEWGLAEFAWRLGAPLWALLASLACYGVVRAVDGPESAGWAALALNALPIFNACAVRVRPELPALTFFLLAVWAVWRALQHEKGFSPCWVWAGLALAAALQFVYAALLLVPGVLLVTLLSPKHRRREDALGLTVFVGLPVAALLPAAWWNHTVEWVPVWRGTWRTVWQADVPGLIAETARLADKFSPLVLLLLAGVWLVTLREARLHLRAHFVALTLLPTVLVAGYLAVLGRDAVLPALLAAPLVLGRVVGWLATVRFGRPVAVVAFAVAAVFSLSSVRRAAESGSGWAAVSHEVQTAFLDHSAGHEGLFLIADDAPTAAILGQYLRGNLIPPPGHPTVYEAESPDISSQFGLWPSYDDFVATDRVVDELFTEQSGENPFLGRSALYLSREPADNLPQAVRGAFGSVTLLQVLPPTGSDPLPLHLYLCLDYQTLPL